MKSKWLPFVLFGAVSALVALSFQPVAAKDHADEKLLAKAKLTREQAEKIALAAVPNATVKEAELEEEDGVMKWSFDLRTPGSKNITEVGVDARTGKIVENKVEDEKDEAKEKDDDEKHKRGEHKEH